MTKPVFHGAQEPAPSPWEIRGALFNTPMGASFSHPSSRSKALSATSLTLTVSYDFFCPLPILSSMIPSTLIYLRPVFAQSLLGK